MNEQDDNLLDPDEPDSTDSEIEELEGNLDILDDSSSEESRDEDAYKKKYDDLYERFVRLAADFDNFKKRNAKERSEVQNYGNEELIKALLNVIDNLERAINHAENDVAEDKSSSFGALIEGVNLVYNQFISCLEKFDVKIVESKEGTEFDPRIHQAIDRHESDKYENGLIISEMLKGYILKERLLRPSMVSVSTGLIENKEDNKDKVYEIEQIDEESVLELDLSDEGLEIEKQD